MQKLDPIKEVFDLRELHEEECKRAENAARPAPETVTVNLQGDLFTRSQVNELIQQIVECSNGTIRVMT